MESYGAEPDDIKHTSGLDATSLEMGAIMEEFWAMILQMNSESHVLTNPLDQVAKFNEIQVVGDQLTSMYDVALTNKATLREFQPATQVSYLELQ